MIPTNRPVAGKDLDAVRQALGLLTADACWLFGLSITRWTQIVRQAPDEPLTDPSLALLVRLLGDHPELSIIPQFPTPAEMYDLVNSIQATDKKRFSVLTGSDASAIYRWLNTGSRQSPAVSRLLFYLKQALLQATPAKRAEVIEEWSKTVELEAGARGSQDIFRTFKWPQTQRGAESEEDGATEKAQPAPAARRGRKKKGEGAA